MKKSLILICLLVVLSIVFGGCESKIDNEDNIDEQDNVIYLEGQYPEYSTLKELVDACDYIIIGKVESVLPTIRENISANNNEAWANYTPSKIVIEKVIVGDKSQGEYIHIRQTGGSFTGISENGKQETITEIANSVVLLEEGMEYLMFVAGENNAEEGFEYPYFLIAPSNINPKIVDGKLVVLDGNDLLENGISVDDVIALLDDAM